MSEQTNGGSAFPEVETETAYDGPSGEHYPRTYSYGGMSLRDYFAGQALAGLLANPFTTEANADSVVGAAWRCADAMLVARKKEK